MKRTLLILGCLLLVFGTTAWFSRDRILASIVKPAIEEAIGGESRLTGLRWTGLGEIGFDDLSIQVDDWPGPAGEVLQVSGLRAGLKLWPLLRGRAEFERVDIDHVRLRIAERHDDPGLINLASLKPVTKPESEGDEPALGVVDIRELSIEVGVSEPDGFNPTSIERFNLRMEPIESEESIQGFLVIQQTVEDESPTLIKGWWNPSTMAFELRLDDLDLTSGSALAMSATARAFCARMQLAGEIQTATVSWRPGTDPQAELKVRTVSMVLPGELGLDEHWVRFSEGRISDEHPPLPRLEVREGTIELDGNRVAFRNFVGQLVPSGEDESILPVKVRLEFETRLGMPDPTQRSLEDLSDWGRDMLAFAPFRLDLSIEDFVNTTGATDPMVVELPRTVANALARLQAVEWDLAAVATASRGRLDEDAGATDTDIQSKGEIYISRGRGAYVNFPYPLHDVSGHLTVENDHVEIDYVSGRGPTGESLTITGNLDGTGSDAGVDLQLQATRIPLDQVLLDALPSKTRAAISRLFDPLATERLEAAGLLVDDDAIARTREEITLVRAALEQAEEADDFELSERIRGDLRRLDARVAAGAFELGGMAAIDLRIHRGRGVGLPVIVEGNIDLRNVGSVFDMFPYPLIASSGRLIIEDEAVRLPDPGISIITPEGARGRITGRIDLPRRPEGGRYTQPDLSFVIAGDLVNPALLAAIPPAYDHRPTAKTFAGWPGEVMADSVRPLSELGLSGPIDCHARVETNAEGSTELRATIVLRNGRINPRTEVTPTTKLSTVWPKGLVMEDCEAVVLIDPNTITLRTFSGRRNSGLMQASGAFDLDSEQMDADATFTNFEVERYMLELFDPEAQLEAERLWNDWQPRGMLEAELSWRSDDTREETLVTLRPDWLAIDAGGTSQTFQRESGDLLFNEDLLDVRGLSVRLEDPGPGIVTMEGTVELGNDPSKSDAPQTLNVVVEDMPFQAPAVDEALRLAAGDDVGLGWRERRPEGRFNGTLTMRTIPLDAAIDFTFVTDRFSMLSVPGDDSSRGGGVITPPGDVKFHDGILTIGPLSVQGDDGTRVDLDLTGTNLDVAPTIDATWRVQAASSTVPEAGFMPPPLSRLVGSDGIQTGRMDAMGAVNIDFIKDGTMADAFASTAEMTFEDGRIDLGGVKVSGITGHTDIDLLAEMEVVTRLKSTSTIPRALIEDRLLTDMVLETSLAEPSGDEQAIDITLTEGTLYEGPVRGNFRFEPGTGRYRVQTTMDDVALSGLANGETESSTEGPSGRVLASLALEGITGQGDSRVGRGELLIRDAMIAGNTGSMAILRLGQLMPPVSQGLDQAEVAFLIDGDEAILSRILLDSPTLQLSGEGRLRISDFSLAARLVPKGQLGVVSDLVSAFTGTVYAIDVEGTPGDPQTSITPLPIIVSPPELEPRAEQDSEKQP